MIDELNARSEAMKMLNDFWSQHTFVVNGRSIERPLIQWQGRNTGEPSDPSINYIRPIWRPLESSQGSLAGDQSTRVWENAGVLSVQCFGALNSGMGLEIAEYLAIMVKRVYQGESSPGCLWFRNVSEKEVGASGAWYQYNTVAQFEYSTVR